MAGTVITKQDSATARAERLHEHLARGGVIKVRKVEDGAVIALLEGRVHGLSKHKLLDRPGYVELSTKQ